MRIAKKRSELTEELQAALPGLLDPDDAIKSVDGGAFVYVDPLIIYPNAWGPFLKGSCHMFTDREHLELLHEVAKSIGLKRAWFQDDRDAGHYDLTAGKRALAVRCDRVLSVTSAQAVAIWKRNRRE